jgi:membrane protein
LIRLLPDRLRAYFERGIWTADARTARGWRRFGLGALRAGYLAARGYIADRCGMRAAALTYITVLSLVPLLAFAFSIAKGLGAYESLQQQVIAPFLDKAVGKLPAAAVAVEGIPIEFLPVADAGEGVNPTLLQLRGAIEQVLEFVANTNVGSLGSIGLVMLVWTVIRLLSSIERTLNEIYGIRRERRLLRKVSDYLAIVLLAPLLVIGAAGITAAGQTQAVLAWMENHLHLGLLLELLVPLVPLLSIWAAFTFVYLCMPNTTNRLVPALLGGIVGGTAWQLAQVLHVKFQIGVARYNALYSGFAAIPIFLIWLYVSWVTVLFGAELASVLQRGATRARNANGVDANQAVREDQGLLAMLELASAFVANEGPLRVQRLAERCGVDEAALWSLLTELRRAGLVAEAQVAGEAAWLVARPPEQIVVTDVLSALRGRADAEWREPGARAERARAALQGLARAEREAAENRTLRELALQRRSGGTAQPERSTELDPGVEGAPA